MPFLLILLLAAGVGTAVVVASKKNEDADSGALEKMRAMLEKYTTIGPSGERVFTPLVATGILRTLGAQLFTHPDVKDSTYIEVHPDPTGAPPGAGLSALDWAKLQNKTLSILAPVYMAETGTTQRFLRAVATGKENFDNGKLYAVVMYAGGFARNAAAPGSPTSAAPVPVVTQVQAAQAQVPAPLQPVFKEVLTKGADPHAIAHAAKTMKSQGLNHAANVLAKKAAAVASTVPGFRPGAILSNLAASAVRAVSNALAPSSTHPVYEIQRLLNSQSPPAGLVEDGIWGPKTLSAVKAFQAANGLKQDGVVGPLTWGKLALGKAA